MMIDWVSCRIPAELPFPVTGGMIIDHDENGEIRMAIPKRLQVEGSFSSKMMFRAVNCDEIELSGNPAKFLQGHNLYGTDNLRKLVAAVLQEILPPIFGFVPPVSLRKAVLTRVDVTDGVLLDREGDVMAYLRSIEESSRLAYKGRGVLDGSTLIFGRSNKGARAKDWQLVMYAKGKEVAKRPLPPVMMADSEVIDWVNRLLRIEVRLRGRELDRLGLKLLGAWEEETASSVWHEKFGKLEVFEVRQVETAELEHLKPRIRNAYMAWRHGEDLSKGSPRATFYRLRREMQDALGIDIAMPLPKTNVVPLIRVIEAKPAHRPPWADRVDRMLAA